MKEGGEPNENTWASNMEDVEKSRFRVLSFQQESVEEVREMFCSYVAQRTDRNVFLISFNESIKMFCSYCLAER